ncbi:MAG: 4-hydroxy-tetrahydrodipicolinate synthase [Cytophagales bacterium]|nr:4-hydroxy-tetrahydrodipicolinate synthase [Cytophagales bacterium]
MHKQFHGTGIALVTPFKDNLQIDFESLTKVIEHSIANGADYLVALGTTGEAPTLSGKEKRAVLEHVKLVNKHRLPMMLGLGGNDTADIISKIEDFDFKSVDGVLSVCPYYNKPTQAGIYEHYTALASKCPVPIIIYNIPGRTGVNIASHTTIKLSENKNIIGIKECTSDFNQLVDVKRGTHPDFLLISGDDILTLPIMSIGGVGVISALANALPHVFSNITSHALNNDFASVATDVQKINEVIKLIFEEGNPVGVKCLLEVMGLTKRNVRLPLVNASESLKDKIQKELQKSALIPQIVY